MKHVLFPLLLALSIVSCAQQPVLLPAPSLTPTPNPTPNPAPAPSPTPAPSPPPTPPSSPVAFTSLKGRVVNWPGGQATFDLQLSDAQGKLISVATGTITSDGSLDASLPTPAEIAPYLTAAPDPSQAPAGCTGGFAASDPTAKFTFMGVFPVKVKNSAAGSVSLNYSEVALPGQYPTHSESDFLIYSDKNVSLNADQQCVSGNFSTVSKASLTLLSGWNFVHNVEDWKTVGSETTMTNTMSNVAVATDQWTYRPASGPTNAQPTQLEGQVTGWTQGAATIPLSVNGHSVGADGVIAADGTVSGPLPTASEISVALINFKEAMTPPAGTTCTGGITVNDDTVLMGSFDPFLLVEVNGKRIGTIAPNYVAGSSEAFSLDGYMYVSSPVTIAGSQTCETGVPGGSTVTMDLTFNAGWNVFHVDIDGKTQTFSNKLYSSPQWSYTADVHAAQMAAQSAKTRFNRFFW